MARSSPRQEQAASVSLRTPQGWVFCTYKEHLLSSSSSIYVFIDLFIEIIVPGSQSQEREVFKALVGGVIYDVLRYL